MQLAKQSVAGLKQTRWMESLWEYFRIGLPSLFQIITEQSEEPEAKRAPSGKLCGDNVGG